MIKIDYLPRIWGRTIWGWSNLALAVLNILVSFLPNNSFFFLNLIVAGIGISFFITEEMVLRGHDFINHLLKNCEKQSNMLEGLIKERKTYLSLLSKKRKEMKKK